MRYLSKMKCLFCPDYTIPIHSLFLTRLLDKHHVIHRSQGGKDTVTICRYHHTLYTDGKISRQQMIDKVNEFLGKEVYYLPYEGSKKIKVREDV